MNQTVYTLRSAASDFGIFTPVYVSRGRHYDIMVKRGMCTLQDNPLLIMGKL